MLLYLHERLQRPGLSKAQQKNVHGMAADLLYAIENDTQPLVNAEGGRWTIEMVSAVYHAQRTHGRVSFPLPDRRHPAEAFRS